VTGNDGADGGPVEVEREVRKEIREDGPKP
jgi:hypothetical protein